MSVLAPKGGCGSVWGLSQLTFSDTPAKRYWQPQLLLQPIMDAASVRMRPWCRRSHYSQSPTLGHSLVGNRLCWEEGVHNAFSFQL